MLPDVVLNENLAEYIDSLESDSPDYLMEMEQKALDAHVPIIRKQAQSLLRFFIKMYQPSKILEIGTAVGFSASYMSEYMPAHCSITTIEKMPERIQCARENFEKIPRKDDIIFLNGDAISVLKDLSDKNETYDFVFLDAAKAQYMNYLDYIMKMLPKGGLFITDNVLQEGSVAESKFGVLRRERTIHTRMREYLYTVKHMEELETIVLPVADGMSVSYRVL